MFVNHACEEIFSARISKGIQHARLCGKALLGVAEFSNFGNIITHRLFLF